MRFYQRFLGGVVISTLMASLLPTSLALADSSEGEFFYNQQYEIKSNEIKPTWNDPTSTGAFTYDYGVPLPPGRNGLTPSLHFSYNNQAKKGTHFYGMGWDLGIPSISRFSNTGVNTLYSENHFSSSLGGTLVGASLTDGVHGEYSAQVEQGDFSEYRYESDGHWEIQTKDGTVYTFGADSASQKFDPDEASHVSEWFLEEVRDTNDNFIRYEYVRDQNEVYPSRIVYTGQGSTDGVFEVNFTWEDRDDRLTHYETGYKVVTVKRLAALTVSQSSMMLGSYTFSYELGSNEISSLLSSVHSTLYSVDGTAVSPSPTEFEYSQAEKTFSSTTKYTESGIESFVGSASPWTTYDAGLRLFDLDGDGLEDFVRSTNDATTSSDPAPQIWINRGHYGSTQEDSTYDFPVAFLNFKSSTSYDSGVRFGDVNGDGKVDLLKSYTGTVYDDTHSNGVYLNNGDGTFTLASSYVLPFSFVEDSTSDPFAIPEDNGLRLFDVNGDGLADLVYSKEQIVAYEPRETSPPPTMTVLSEVYLNKGNGTGWELSSAFTIPVGFFDAETGVDKGIRAGDINGDGLLDFVKAYPQENAEDCTDRVDCIVNGFYINQGDGTWAVASSSSFSTEFFNFVELRSASSVMDGGFNLMDINADGLDDVVGITSDGSTIYSTTFLNQLTRTTDSDFGYDYPVAFTETLYDGEIGTRVTDLNGDGLLDFIQSGPTSHGILAYLQDGEVPDLLTGVTTREGAHVEINYQASPEYNHAEGSEYVPDNPQLPYSVQTVSAVRYEDGLGEEKTVSYDYEDGEHFYEDLDHRGFGGFAMIRRSEEGRVTETYYQQEEWEKIGKVARVDVYDDSGFLYQRQLYEWGVTDLGDGSEFVHQDQEVSMTYDATTSHRDSAITYTYDSYGNVKTVVNYGEVDSDEDGDFTDVTVVDEKTTATYSYATGSTVHSKVSEVVVKNSSGMVLTKTRHFYDGLGYGSVSTGNLTRLSQWDDVATTWNSTDYTYNSYGLVSSVKNPRGNTTSFTYDSLHLYPQVTTNAKGYTLTALYDYASGQITRLTDENGFVRETQYDGLGRPVSVSVPNPTSGALTVLSTTSYNDASVPTSASTVTTVSGVTSQSVTYMDGYGRTVQTNTLAEDALWNTVDFWYDELGNVSEQSLPYSTSSSTFGRDGSKPSVSTSYDALSRPVTVTSPTGTSTYDYVRWETRVTDPNGHDKTYGYDSAGHLLQVDEENGSSTYSTVYTYDALGELTGFKDAQGNVRHFDYDSLGRKLSQEDLHKSTETSFGTYTYTYDKNNNLLTQKDPKAQIITWAYDTLDRVTSEDWDSATPAKEFTTAYDTATNGKMKVAKVTSNLGDTNVTYSYDALGNVSQETRALKKPAGSTFYTYAFQTTSDLLGRPTKVVYPSSALTVNYTYNELGKVEKVTRGTSPLVNVVSDIDYTPAGQVSQMTYLNGVTTTNTYDPAEAYRLTKKVTNGRYSPTLLGAPVSPIQDLTYHYDANGNITSIADASSTPTAKTLTYTYDDLNRLTSAASSGFASGDYSESYSYDSVGNITSKSGVGTLSYSGTGASGKNPHAVTSVGSATYAYDLNGNLTSDGTHSYAWDKRNRLASSGALAYSYDASGSRYKTVDSTSGTASYTYYVSRYEELRGGTATSAGTPTYYIFAGDQRVAALEGLAYSYYLDDHLGGTTLTTNAGGYVTQIYDYYPYGTEALNTKLSTTDARHSFTDKELEDALGLYYFEARWYNPTIGRFTSQDPMQWEGVTARKQGMRLLADPQSLNFYAYSRSNPLVYVDPSGEFFGIAALIGLAITTLTVALTSGVQIANAPDINTQIESVPQSQITADIIKTSVGLVIAGKALEAVTEAAKIVMSGSTILEDATISSEAASAKTAVYNKSSFQSLQQMGESGYSIAGKGTGSIFRDAGKFAEKYGGKAEDYVKMSSETTGLRPNGKAFETHWVENIKTGEKYNVKTKFTSQ